MICPSCKKENRSTSTYPFCSYECADNLFNKNPTAFKKKHYAVGNCKVCAKEIYIRGGRKYCSPDCVRVAVQSVDKSRREPIPSRYKNLLHTKHEGRCAYCGEEANSIDHIYPVARGGRTIEENLVPACMSCNLAAGSKTFKDFEEKKKYILDRRGIANRQYKEDVSDEVVRPKWHAWVYAGKKRK